MTATASGSGSGSSTAPLAGSSKIVQPLQPTPTPSAPLALATEAPPSTSSAKISPPSLGGLGLGLSAIDRKAMEDARRQRQKERRRAQGLKSESEDSEGEMDAHNEVGGQKQAYLLPPTSSGSQAGSGNFKSRSYISEVEPPRPAGKGRVRGFEDLTRDAEDGGGSSSGSAIGGASALSGLGGVSGSKPALRRILAGDRFWDGTVKVSNKSSEPAKQQRPDAHHLFLHHRRGAGADTPKTVSPSQTSSSPRREAMLLVSPTL